MEGQDNIRKFLVSRQCYARDQLSCQAPDCQPGKPHKKKTVLAAGQISKIFAKANSMILIFGRTDRSLLGAR